MTLEELKGIPFVEPLDKQANYSDYAKSIMALYKFKTLADTDEVLYYKDGVWGYGGEIIIKQECERNITECSNYDVSQVIGKIKRKTFEERKNFNKDLTKLVLANGILDLVTFELNPFDPDFLTTIKLPISYDPKARCPKFIKFLKEILSDPEDIITIIEEISNILTTNIKNFEVSAIWTGSGANGKSTLLKIIRGVIGAENCASVSLHAMQEERFAIAQLYSKLANIHGDISNKELNNLGAFKQLVSGDALQVEKKNKDPFDLYNFAKMFYAANEMPDIKDNSDGAFRRILVTKFENIFLPGVNRIDDLYKIILESEQSGIFNLIVENYKTLLRNNGFRYQQSIAEVRSIIKRESDKLLEFIKLCFTEDPNGVIIKDKFFDIQQQYMSDKNYEIYSKRKLGNVLPNYGFRDATKKINGKPHRVWLGFTLKREDDWVKTHIKGLDEYV